MLRNLYGWMMRLAARPDGWRWLALEAFCEGIFFPIPPDLMLMPMVLARRERAWIYAAIVVVSSLAGGSVGYAIGFFVESIGRTILSMTGTSGAQLDAFLKTFQQYGILLIALPIPYKLTAIVSGLAHFNFGIFIAASAAIRGARFFLVAGLVRAYGPPIQGFVEKRLAFVVSGVAIAVVLAIFALKLLH